MASQETRDDRKPEFTFPVDIHEEENEFVLVGDLPGVSGETLDVQVDQGSLTIRGRMNLPVREGTRLLEEYQVGDHVRKFILSDDIDASGIDGELKNGVLTLRLPKVAEVKPKKIPVQVG